MRTLTLSALLLCLCAGIARSAEFTFAHDHILGTSLDLVIYAPDERVAQNAERAVLDEVERLRLILSTYDASTPAAILNSTSEPVKCPAELIEILRAYEHHQARSGGAYSPNLGLVISTWKAAAKTGVEPDSQALSHLAARAALPAWRIDSERNTVQRLDADVTINLDSLGKGYVIGKAMDAARRACPEVTGLLINIGGDIRTWGRCEQHADGAFRLAIQDPAHPQENAPSLMVVRLKDRAIATSAAYERFYQFGDKRYSHILDARTGRPAQGVASATVIADDNVTANALATTLCVLGAEEGLKLVGRTPGAEALIVDPAGQQFRTPGFVALQDKPKAAPAGNDAWGKGYGVNISLTVLRQQGRKTHRPYVAVWIEKDNKPVRTLTVWGRERKYLKDLPAWWGFAQRDNQLVQAVTRATRSPGEYKLQWDGLDEAGKPVPAGTYTVVIETNREKGRYAKRTGTIRCGGTDEAKGTVPEGNDVGESTLVYGKM